VSGEDPYIYPDTYNILKNKFGLKDPDLLAAAENEHVAQRIEEGSPRGNFDLAHLKAIHRHLFQDIYAWAGEVRTVELHKAEDVFLPVSRIEMGMADIHTRLSQRDFLKGLSPKEFAREAAHIIGDLNYIHPFREGNGRTQLQYLRQLAEQAGHQVDLTRLNKDEWLEASRAANRTDYEPMRRAIAATLAVEDGD
jgi:cell filamentation protein